MKKSGSQRYVQSLLYECSAGLSLKPSKPFSLASLPSLVLFETFRILNLEVFSLSSSKLGHSNQLVGVPQGALSGRQGRQTGGSVWKLELSGGPQKQLVGVPQGALSGRQGRQTGGSVWKLELSGGPQKQHRILICLVLPCGSCSREPWSRG